jgi:flagellar protein FliL
MSDAKEAAPPKKKKGKLIIILAAVLILASGGGGAGWYFGFRAKPADKETEKPRKVVPVYLNLEPFVVNLTGSDNYLQVGVVYALESNDLSEAIKVHMPALRSRVLLRLSAKTVAELGSIEGKQKLTEEIITDARQSLDEAQRKGILAMHFSSFVIQ